MAGSCENARTPPNRRSTAASRARLREPRRSEGSRQPPAKRRSFMARVGSRHAVHSAPTTSLRGVGCRPFYSTLSRYPIPRTVCSQTGLDGSRSILRRSRLICTSMVRSPTSDVAADQFVARDGLAGALGEDRQDLLLAVGELQRLAALLQLAPRDLERVGPEHDLLDLRRRLRAAAPQDVVDPQDQFARIERLRQIVVGAGLQPGDAAVRLRQRRQHQDRHLLFGAQRLGQLDAVLARHHHVEHQQVEVEAFQLAARLGGVAGDRDAEAVLGEILLQAGCGCGCRRRRRADAAHRRPAPPDGRSDQSVSMACPLAWLAGRLSICGLSSGLTIAFRNCSIAARSAEPDSSNARTDAARLWPRQGQRQRAALGGRVELALAAVARALHLHDVAGVDQLLQHARQALLGDLQHVEQFGDRQARPAVDEMQHPVMGAAEAVVGEDLVGVGGEVAIGEEQQLDDREVDAVLARQRRPDRFGRRCTACLPSSSRFTLRNLCQPY